MTSNNHTQPEELLFIDDEPKIETATGYQLDVVGKNTYGSRSRESGESDTSYRQYLMNFKIDQSKSLNDQYAEIEQVRQNVFKATDFGVSGLPEFKHDFVNHPKHYCDHPSGIECIDAIEAGMSEEMFEGYLKGCCNKYLWRYKTKGGSESLRKAQWYLDRLIKLNEKIESRK